MNSYVRISFWEEVNYISNKFILNDGICILLLPTEIWNDISKSIHSSGQEDDIAEYYQQQVEVLEGFNEMDALAERGFIPGMSKVYISFCFLCFQLSFPNKLMSI